MGHGHFDQIGRAIRAAIVYDEEMEALGLGQDRVDDVEDVLLLVVCGYDNEGARQLCIRAYREGVIGIRKVFGGLGGVHLNALRRCAYADAFARLGPELQTQLDKSGLNQGHQIGRIAFT